MFPLLRDSGLAYIHQRLDGHLRGGFQLSPDVRGDRVGEDVEAGRVARVEGEQRVGVG